MRRSSAASASSATSRSSKRHAKRRKKRNRNSIRVQASDNYFFEQFQTGPTVTVLNISTTDPSSSNSTGPAPLSIVRLSINDNPQNLHELYVEALYTIVHKVGRSSLPVPEHQLIRYAQQAFQIDEVSHTMLMDRAKKEKPPIVLLNVQLLEARDLVAKDINGFSDPFTMMGVVPGRRASRGKNMNSQNSMRDENGAIYGDGPYGGVYGADDDFRQEDGITPPHSPSAFSNSGMRNSPDARGGSASVLQRFGGSFRRKLGGGSRKGAKSPNTAIPCKLIKASSVQYKTLNPKWNEKFQFGVDDVATDKFHLDIWDHDDEETRVLDAVTSLNQISGLKGLGRYFKEVAQSTRAGSNDLLDDFLGSVTIKIKDVPSQGLEDWFLLEKRSERSQVTGHVLLRLWLSTKEERRPTTHEDDDQPEELVDVKQHVELIRQFALSEIRTSGAPVGQFQGHLPEPAVTILHQHAIQGDLTELHQAMCQWLAYNAMINIGISYAFLYDILSNLISKWRPLALDKDHEDLLAESFEAFNESCRRAILDHRSATNKPSSPGGSKTRLELDSFGNMIRCLKLMRESPLYNKCVPFHKEFLTDIADILVESANNYFRSLQLESQSPPRTACDELYILVEGINQACAKFSQFDPIFKSYAEVDYAHYTYQEFDRLLFEYISSEMMSEKHTDLKSMLLKVPEDESTLVAILKVHCVLKEFNSYHKPKARYKMESVDWSSTFDRAISKWLDVAKVKAFARVELACQLDAQIQIQSSNEIRHTSSYVDICHIIEQLMWFWEHVLVKDLLLRTELTEKLVQSICKIAEYYVDRVMTQLAADGFHGQLQPNLSPAIINIFCAAINNSEQVRRSLAITDKLHLDELSEMHEKKFRKEATWRIALERDLTNCEKYIGEQIESSVDRMVRRQIAQLKKHVFHLAWSPAACPVEQSLKPLTDMLDSELSLVHRTLLHRNFVRVMYSQVNVLLQLLQECVTENAGLEPTFYQRLSEAWNILQDFFHAEGKGISLEAFETIPAHKVLNDVNECKYGILNLRAYYNSNSQTLVIDVIGAKQVIPLDSNGLSDPFVVMELVPRCRYASQPTARTKVVSKSLNPIFDETFEFHMPPKIFPSSMVHFVVMDHDFLRSNDFAGEAFLDLAEVPGFGQPGMSNTLRQFNLILIHPSRRPRECVNVLGSRKEDKDAQEFVRSLTVTY
ncbi:c2 domain-containing protein [Ditylenchus destructor]|nr:c2 domain-containing protein [Ditylenchus destructor]